MAICWRRHRRGETPASLGGETSKMQHTSLIGGVSVKGSTFFYNKLIGEFDHGLDAIKQLM
jgi:hypothetical protein